MTTKSAVAPALSDPLTDIASRIDAGSRQIGQRISTLEARQSLHERKSRALHAVRQEADDNAGRPDPLRGEKMARINADIDSVERRELAELRLQFKQLQRKAARPHGPLGSPATSHKSAEQELFSAQVHYLRTGRTAYKGQDIRDLEAKVYGPGAAKAMHSGSNGDGGYLVTPQEDGSIEKLLAQVVPMRQIASVTTITAAEYKKYVRTSTGGAKWGNELNSGGETGTPKYAMLNYPAHNLYAEPLATRDLVEDSSFDIIGEINDGCLEDFSLTEGIAFISGDGVEKPLGILGYAAANYVANASWAFGKVGYVVTGASGSFPTPTSTVGSGDSILRLPLELKAAYRQSAKWLGNRSTIGACRTLKDALGSYVWIQSDLARGIPATLAGHEFVEAEQMPDIGANSFSLALADWGRAYKIVDRSGMSVLRDDLTKYPAIAFKTAKRVGGGIMNFEAIKLLKFGTA